MALHGSAVLHTDCVYDDGVPEHTVVDAGPFRTTTTCTDLLPRYYGYVYRVVVSAAQCTSLAPLHARTHARTYRLHLHPSPALPATRAACRRAVGGRPVVRLSVSCAVCAALLLCGSVSAYQWPPSALPACLSACLPACPPARLARARQKIIISRLPGTLYDTMLLPADPPHAGLSTWRPRYGLYGRSDSKGRQPSRDAHTRQCHPCPLLPPRAPFTR